MCPGMYGDAVTQTFTDQCNLLYASAGGVVLQSALGVTSHKIAGSHTTRLTDLRCWLRVWQRTVY